MNIHHRRFSPGFTLIELLTVIAIIGILAAILIPTVGKVRSQARNAQCLSNMRQLALATNMYADDNKNLFPLGRNTSNETYWYHTVPLYLGDSKTGYGANFSKVLTCPSAELPPTAVDRTNYGANPRILAEGALSKRVPRSSILRPTETVFCTDSGNPDGRNASWGIWAQTGITNTAEAAADEAVADSSSNTGNAVIRWRHDGRASFAFVDGHAASIALGSLKQRNLQIAY